MAAVLAGLVLFFVGNEAPVVTAPDPAKGNLLALHERRLVRRDDRGPPLAVARGGGLRLATVAIGNLIAFFWGLPFALPVHVGHRRWTGP